MIGHQAVRADTHRAAFERLLDDPLESLEVRIFQTQTHTAQATIQDVEHHPAGGQVMAYGVSPDYPSAAGR